MNAMNTKTKLENALKDAMRANDEVRKRTLRMALSSMKLAEIEKGDAVDEASLLVILQKEINSRHESITDAERAGRQDLIGAAQAEIAILEEYLPKPFSMSELEELAKQAISETGATSMREMGQVMKVLMPRLQGRATGDQASQEIRKILG
jgi:uncharacterized protein YqeY